MKKILLLTNMYPSKDNPSYGVFVKKTYDYLKEDFDIKLVCIRKSDNKMYKIWKYVCFYFEALFWGLFFKYDCIYAHYISHCVLPVKIIKLFKKDLLVIGNVHGEDVFSEYEEYQNNKVKAQSFIRIADYIIAPSEYFKKRLEREYSMVPEKIFVSPSGGVDTEFFCHLDKKFVKDQIDLEASTRYIGYVSRIETGKGWDVFLNAMSKIVKVNDNLKAIIVGTGREKKDLERLIKDLEISDKVLLLPLLAQKDLTLVFNSMDIFCFPSRRTAESLGLVGLEAMSCEVPCIITNSEGPSTYAIDGYNCLQFEPQNETELVEKILKLLNMDKNQKEVLVSNARKTALLFDKIKVKDEFCAFFKEIL